MLVTQSCPTLCNPVDCSPPGSSVHGILQARILQWVAISFSRGSSQPRDQTQISLVAQNLSAIQETQVRSLVGEDALEKEMATHSSVLAWEIPWTEEPGGATVYRAAQSQTQLSD